MSAATPDPTQVLLADVVVAVEAIVTAVLAQRDNAANAAAAGEAVVTDLVALAKEAISAVPSIPPFVAGLLENDALLTPFVTDIAAMVEKTLAAAIVKLETATGVAAPVAPPAA